jgi:hypothetical protein
MRQDRSSLRTLHLDHLVEYEPFHLPQDPGAPLGEEIRWERAGTLKAQEQERRFFTHKLKRQPLPPARTQYTVKIGGGGIGSVGRRAIPVTQPIKGHGLVSGVGAITCGLQVDQNRLPGTLTFPL